MELEKLIPKNIETFLGIAGAILLLYLYENRTKIGDSIYKKFNKNSYNKKQLINRIENHEVFRQWDIWRDYKLPRLSSKMFTRDISEEEKQKRLFCIRTLSTNNVNIYAKHLKEFVNKLTKEHDKIECNSFKCNGINKYMNNDSWGDMIRTAYIEFYEKTVKDGVPSGILDIFYEYHAQNEIFIIETISRVVKDENMTCLQKILEIFDTLEIEARLQENNIIAIANLNGRVSNILKDWEIPKKIESYD